MTLLFLGEDAGHFSKGSQGGTEESAPERVEGGGQRQARQGTRTPRPPRAASLSLSLAAQKLMCGTTPKPLDRGERGTGIALFPPLTSPTVSPGLFPAVPPAG